MALYKERRGEKVSLFSVSEIVKYDNYLNQLALSGFSAVELDLLMTICAKMKNQELNSVKLSFDEIRGLAAYSKNSNDELIKSLKETNIKLSRIACTLENESDVIQFVLFTTFWIQKREKALIIQVNPDFRFVLNALDKNFTRFELSEFIRLNGRYPKQLYRLLKQFRSTGVFRISLQDLREKMDIPETYDIRDIREKVLKPAIKEISPYFEDLKFEAKKEKRRGNPVTGYEFTFKKENVKNIKDDVAGSSKENIKKTSNKKGNKDSGKKKGNFYNFEQRNDYDYKELERQLLNMDDLSDYGVD